MDFNLKV